MHVPKRPWHKPTVGGYRIRLRPEPRPDRYSDPLTEETTYLHLEGEDGPKIGGIGTINQVNIVNGPRLHRVSQSKFRANPRGGKPDFLRPRLSQGTAVRAVGRWRRHALTPRPRRTDRIAVPWERLGLRKSGFPPLGFARNLLCDMRWSWGALTMLTWLMVPIPPILGPSSPSRCDYAFSKVAGA